MRLIQSPAAYFYVYEEFSTCGCPVTMLANAQWRWQNVDSLYQPLPASMHVYRSNDSTDGKPNIAYYVSVDLKDKSLDITSQVGNGKRLTPSQYFEQEGNHCW
jgi:hypothetical protein